MTGCPRCWGDDGDAMAAGQARLEHGATLVHESHFSVVVKRCGECQQSYAQVACEVVSFTSDNDLRGDHSIPLSPSEATQLATAASSTPAGQEVEMKMGAMLQALAPRPHLIRVGRPKRIDGPILLLPHD